MKIIKNNFKKIGLLTLFLSGALYTQAQYLDDGLRFSRTDLGASARFKAMGGAQTSLGGDLSSIAGNPAGLGFYNNSDASFTLDFQNDLNRTSYFGSKIDKNKNNLGFEQAAVLFHMPVHKRPGQHPQTGWLNFNVGLAYNKTQNFNTSIDFTGENDISSFTDMLADESAFANNSYPNSDYNNLYDEWGYDSYLVDHNGTFFYPTTSENEKNRQNNLETRFGNQYETNISFGANYGNQFYIGASVGIASFHYESKRTFTEIGYMKNATEFYAVNPNSEFLVTGNQANNYVGQAYDLALTTDQITDGSGINATLGIIFLPHRMWRIGISATTPTWYQVRDDYRMFFDSWMVDAANDNELYNYQSPDKDGVSNYYNEYDLRTPYRINAGIAALFEEGLVSADIEFVDYASIRINQDSYTDDVKANFKGAMNFRLGGEYKLDPQFLIRAGYNYQSSPYKDLESTRQLATAGLGYRINNVYVDFTYLNQLQKQEYLPYSSYTNPTEVAKIDNQRNSVMLTLGVKF